MTDPNLLLLAAGWALYGLLHSLLAAPRCKDWMARRMPGLRPWYRLAYNAFALLSALPLLWLIAIGDGPMLIQWTGAWHWPARVIALIGGVGLLISFGAYDLVEFIGLRQWRAGAAANVHDEGEFRIGFCNRYVRHPWYFFSLLILWTQDMNAALLISAVAITIYLVIGSRLEEHKLIAAHGATYRRYMARVPGLFPVPWKHLTAAEAAELTRR